MPLNYKRNAHRRLANGKPLDDGWVVRWSLVYGVLGAGTGVLLVPIPIAIIAWAFADGEPFGRLLMHHARHLYTTPIVLPIALIVGTVIATILNLSHFGQWRTKYLIKNARCLGCSYPLPSDGSRKCPECGIVSPTSCSQH